MHAFFAIDFSRTPVEKELKTPVHLVSYADGPDYFHQNQRMLTYSALQKGVSHIFNYRRDFIDTDFYKKNKYILDQKSGVGAWLWKPWVIMITLQKIPENAVLLYCDSGFIIKRDITPLLDLLKNHDMALAAYSKEEGGLLGQLTKKEALTKTGCDTTACRKAPLIWAGFLCMRNTPRTRAFIHQWLTYCQDPDLILPHTKFAQQRHQYDQSLLSITYFKNPQGITLVNAEKTGFNNILRWHHRNNLVMGEDSLMLKLENGIKGWERKIIDSSLSKMWARWIYKFSRQSPEAPQPIKVLEVGEYS